MVRSVEAAEEVFVLSVNGMFRLFGKALSLAIYTLIS